MYDAHQKLKTFLYSVSVHTDLFGLADHILGKLGYALMFSKEEGGVTVGQHLHQVLPDCERTSTTTQYFMIAFIGL